jgi:hypothetical protein
MNRIQHGPQQVTFELKRFDRRLLQRGCGAILQSKCERFSRIASGLGQPVLKVFQALWLNSLIEFFEGSQSFGHQVRRKKLGK